MRKIRLFRLKHHIPLREIAESCGISIQRLSQIELGISEITPATETKIMNGLLMAIERREHLAQELECDYHRIAPTIMDYVEVTYEL